MFKSYIYILILPMSGVNSFALQQPSSESGKCGLKHVCVFSLQTSVAHLTFRKFDNFRDKFFSMLSVSRK